MAIIRQKMLIGSLSQTAADTTTDFLQQSSLSDNDGGILLVKSIEVDITASVMVTFANAADWWVNITFATEATNGLGATVFADPHLLGKFQWTQLGVAAAVTDRMAYGQLVFKPDYPLYIVNETFYVAITSSGTGVAVGCGYRIVVDKITITQLEKTILKQF